jgi:hypothetical protein
MELVDNKVHFYVSNPAVQAERSEKTKARTPSITTSAASRSRPSTRWKGLRREQQRTDDASRPRQDLGSVRSDSAPAARAAGALARNLVHRGPVWRQESHSCRSGVCARYVRRPIPVVQLRADLGPTRPGCGYFGSGEVSRQPSCYGIATITCRSLRRGATASWPRRAWASHCRVIAKKRMTR